MLICGRESAFSQTGFVSAYQSREIDKPLAHVNETHLNHRPMDVFVFEPAVRTVASSMNTAPRWIALSAGVLGFTGVALGAFGAHALKETLTARASLPTWQTAVLYQLVHSIALLVIAGWPVVGGKIVWAARCWTAGIILFSGSLYSLSLGGPIKFIWPITPLGGLAFLLGWLFIAWNAFQSPRA